MCQSKKGASPAGRNRGSRSIAETIAVGASAERRAENLADVGRAKVDFGPATDTGVAATTGAAADVKCGRFDDFDNVDGDGRSRGRQDRDLLRLPAPTTSMGAARCSNETGARRARATAHNVTTTACRTRRVYKQAVCTTAHKVKNEATLPGGDGRGAEVYRNSRRCK